MRLLPSLALRTPLGVLPNKRFEIDRSGLSMLTIATDSHQIGSVTPDRHNPADD